MGIDNKNTMTLEEGYAIVGAGFKDTVYVVRNHKIHREIIFSGLSLADAVQLKKDGALFLSYEEARSTLGLTNKNPTQVNAWGINASRISLDEKKRNEILDAILNAYNTKRYDAMVNHFADLHLPLEGLRDAFIALQSQGKYMIVSDEAFEDMCAKITLESKFLYFLIPHTEMEKAGIRVGDSERQIAKALSGEDDCIYSEDLIKDFHHLDLNSLLPDQIPFLNDPVSSGLVVEWDAEAGEAIDVWYGTFADHSGVKAMMMTPTWVQNAKAQNPLFGATDFSDIVQCGAPARIS